MTKTTRILFSGILLGFLFVILFSLYYLTVFTGETVGLFLTFSAGLSMIFLPCTLPLVFVIVPMALKKSPVKGFLTALFFGLGLVLTLTAYGIVVSQLGKYLGLDKFTRLMFTFAGVFAIVFGWSELSLLKLNLPEFSVRIPKAVSSRGEYVKAFFMGLLLGNAGVGCPNPAFYLILTYIATVGSALTGAVYGFVHGVGRVVPLLFVVSLAILGVNSTSWIVKRSKSIHKFTGWALVFVGGFILTFGIFGMGWWEGSIFHEGWNEVVRSIAPNLAEEEGHKIREGFVETGNNIIIPWVFMFFTFISPILVRRLKGWKV